MFLGSCGGPPNNLLYSDPTKRRKLVVCCANFTTILLCSVGPVSKALGKRTYKEALREY